MERTVAIPLAGRLAPRAPKRVLALRSDDRLVDLVRAGDEAAFEVLYERHVAGVLGFCRHMLGSPHEAEDAVQQAFVSAHGALRGDSRTIAFKPWLYTIARNRCLSILRARREQPAELGEISTAGLDERVERSAELRQLVADVQHLPEDQRAALVLTELGDLSHAEVAAVIGREPPAIKGLVFRARATLAERRAARTADCHDIRLELAAARGGGLRRGRLRYHLEACPACVAYLEEVRRQRKLLGIALPVVPTLALRDSVMGSAGVGAGAAGVGASGGGLGAAATGGAGAAGGGTAVGGVAAVGGGATAGGAATLGGALIGGTAVKLAIAGAIVVGGAGIATDVVRDGGETRPEPPPAAREDASGGGAGLSGAAEGATASGPATRALERRRGARGAQRRELARQLRAGQRGKGRLPVAKSRGKAVGRERGAAIGRGDGKAGGNGRQNGAGKGAVQIAPRTGLPRNGVGKDATGQPGAGGQSGGAPGSSRRSGSAPGSAPRPAAPPATGGAPPSPQVKGPFGKTVASPE